MVADPYETTNLWRTQPAVVADLYGALKRICRDESSGLPFDVPLRSAPYDLGEVPCPAAGEV